MYNLGLQISFRRSFCVLGDIRTYFSQYLHLHIWREMHLIVLKFFSGTGKAGDNELQDVEDQELED